MFLYLTTLCVRNSEITFLADSSVPCGTDRGPAVAFSWLMGWSAGCRAASLVCLAGRLGWAGPVRAHVASGKRGSWHQSSELCKWGFQWWRWKLHGLLRPLGSHMMPLISYPIGWSSQRPAQVLEEGRQILPLGGRGVNRFTTVFWEFPGGPVVRTLHFHCQRPGCNPWSGN